MGLREQSVVGTDNHSIMKLRKIEDPFPKPSRKKT